MSVSTSVSASATERQPKRRLWVRRILTSLGVVLALAGGTVVDAGTASAQVPPGACTRTCNAPVPPVSTHDWNHALMAADWWANHQVDWQTHTWSNGSYRPWIREARGHGWPNAAGGHNWFGFHDGPSGYINFIYYGGRFDDRSGLLSAGEQQGQHVPASQAHSTWTDPFGYTHYSPYVEYDIDAYPNAQVPRNARRIVRNVNNGHVWVTYDHYQSFYFLGTF